MTKVVWTMLAVVSILPVVTRHAVAATPAETRIRYPEPQSVMACGPLARDISVYGLPSVSEQARACQIVSRAKQLCAETTRGSEPCPVPAGKALSQSARGFWEDGVLTMMHFRTHGLPAGHFDVVAWFELGPTHHVLVPFFIQQQKVIYWPPEEYPNDSEGGRLAPGRPAQGVVLCGDPPRRVPYLGYVPENIAVRACEESLGAAKRCIAGEFAMCATGGSGERRLAEHLRAQGEPILLDVRLEDAAPSREVFLVTATFGRTYERATQLTFTLRRGKATDFAWGNPIP